jgi:hypothetical protein
VESTLVESDEALSIHLLSNDGIIAQLVAMGIIRILLDTGDDSAWPHIHLPHDALIMQGVSNVSCTIQGGGCSGRSFIPRHVMWYRKSFALPAGWGSVGSERTDHLWVKFDGVFHAAVVYMNGVVVARNSEGYLGFRVPLGNTTGTLRGDGERNVLAVFVDLDGSAGFSSIGRNGWWYEGGECAPAAAGWLHLCVGVSSLPTLGAA